MEDELVGFEVAKLAKEKGFKERCREVWEEDFFGKHGSRTIYGSGLQNGVYLRPTQSFLQKWLREVHNIDCTPIFDVMTGKYRVSLIENGNLKIVPFRTVGEGKYEPTLEEGLKESLLLLNNIS